MSTKAMSWAWTVTTSTPSERLVLLALADHAGDDGECWPGGTRLATKTGLSEQSVRRYITLLEERGLLVKVERRRRKDGTLGTWLYRLEVDSSSQVTTSANRLPVVISKRTSANGLAVDQCSPISSHESSLTEPSEESSELFVVESVHDAGSTFEAFWKTYPRKTAKKAAMAKWVKMSATDRQEAISRLPSHIDYWQKTGTESRFIPHATTWLNQERFNDDLANVEAVTSADELFDTMTPWLDQRGFLERIDRAGVVTAIEILTKWKFGPGEIAVRIAAMSRSHLDQIILPRQIAIMNGFARFTGHPQHHTDPVSYFDAMERAYQNQSWT